MVSDIQSEELETPEKVYNFEVADWHTYYVSEFGVLVHNKGSNSCGEFGDELVEGMGEAVSTKSGFTLTNHAIDQLGEARFGGKLSIDRLDELMHSKDAIRVIDGRTGNINVYVQSEFSSSSLMRITVPNDGNRIVSIGFEPLKRIGKFINSGDFIPLN